MTAELIRSFTPDLQVRSTGNGGDGRTIEGIAVPYGQAQRITESLTEQFARGAFNHQLGAPHRVWFARDHVSQGGSPIGRAIELRDDAAGLWGAWRVSATPAGDETLTLIEDGVLDELSVGFQERQNRRLRDGTIERVKANLVEVSVVLQGAYGRGALVSAVRDAQDTNEVVAATCTCGAASRAAQAAAILANLPVFPPAA